MSFQYTYDTKGKAVGVFVPINEWEKITTGLQKKNAGNKTSKDKNKILTSVAKGMKEVNKISKGKLRSIPLTQLLDALLKIEATPEFLKEAKKIAKKYSSLKKNIADLAEQLAINPTQGTPLGKDAFKIRLAITSKGKGKSGGARVITCVKIISTIVYLVSIYDKSEQGDISDEELKERINNL